jgi:hypothetical protein
VLGKTYKVTYSISDYVSGNFKAQVGSNGFGQERSSNGTFVEYIEYSGSNFLYLKGSSSFTGSVTNISVKEVGQDWTVTNSDANNYVEFNQEQGTARLKFLNTSPITTLQSTAQYVSGKKYKLIVDVAEVVSGGIKIDAAGVSQTYNSVGIQEAIIEPTGTSFISFYRATSNVDITLNSVSVKEITDDTDLPRINYSGFSYQDTLGSELVVNGDFSNGLTNWYVDDGTSWTNVNNTAFCDGNNGLIAQNHTATQNKVYKVTFDSVATNSIGKELGVRIAFYW